MSSDINYSLSLAFENVSLPPFEDILVLTRKAQYGKLGVSSSLNLLQPDKFVVVEVNNHEIVEAILVNRRILKRLPAKIILDVLRERVFPYIDSGEIVRIDFKVKLSYNDIKLKVGDPTNESETSR